MLRRDGDEQPLASGEVGPASGHLFDPAVRERSLASFARLITDVSKVARPDCIAAGVTGLGAGTPPAMTYAGVLSEGLGTPPVAIAIGDDMWIAYRALFAPGEGGLVYAGTGSVGYAIGKDGLALKVGGYGILIDDAGSGFWIAREAIRRILRARDEDPVAQSVLADLLYERVGGSGWPIIREAVYGSDRGAIAALAPVVARASDAGDATALPSCPRQASSLRGSELSWPGAAGFRNSRSWVAPWASTRDFRTLFGDPAAWNDGPYGPGKCRRHGRPPALAGVVPPANS